MFIEGCLESGQSQVDFHDQRMESSFRDSSLVTPTTSHRYLTFQCQGCGAFYRARVHCSDKFCGHCGVRRASRIRRKYLPVVKSMSAPKFLTLTLRARYFSRESHAYIRRCFAKLRKMPFWKARGGIYAIEPGYIDEFGFCNLHLHAIIDSPYLPHDQIEDAWADITRDSWKVDIRQVKSQYGALRYVTEYVTKVPDVAMCQRDMVNGVYRGMRLIQTFGDLGPCPSMIRSPCPCCGSTFGYVLVDFDPSLEGFSPRGTAIVPADAIVRWSP